MLWKRWLSVCAAWPILHLVFLELCTLILLATFRLLTADQTTWSKVTVSTLPKSMDGCLPSTSQQYTSFTSRPLCCLSLARLTRVRPARGNVAAIYIVHLPSIVLSFACLTYAGTSSPRSSFPLLTCSQDSRSATPRAFGVSLSLTVSRFMPLIFMSILHMVWALNHRIYPSLYRLIHSVETADLHSDFLRVDQFYLCIFPENVQHSYYFLWWTVHSSTFIFFASSC